MWLWIYVIEEEIGLRNFSKIFWKSNNSMLNGKTTIIILSVALILKVYYVVKMSQYFHKQCSCFGETVKIEWDLSNYASKSDVKLQQALIHQCFQKKVDSINLKWHVEKLLIN